MKTDNTQYQEKVIHLFRDLGTVLRYFQNETTLCENITFGQYNILDHINTNGGTLELSRLHDLLSVEKSTTTRMIEPLVTRGLIRKDRSVNDSRVIEITLTTEGGKVYRKVHGCILSFVDMVVDQIPEDERNSTVGTLSLFISAIRKCCGRKGCC